MADNALSDKRQYDAAIIEMMAQGARGAVLVNMIMSNRVPPLARIPASVVAASGFAGVQAFRSLWDGAMGRPLVRPPYRGPIEEVVSDALVSGGSTVSGAIAIGRPLPKAFQVGGRVATAVAASEAAAEVVRQVARAAHSGALGERARELIATMQADAVETFGAAAARTAMAANSVRTGVRDLAAATAASASAAVSATASGASAALRTTGRYGGRALEATRSGLGSAAGLMRGVDLGNAIGTARMGAGRALEVVGESARERAGRAMEALSGPLDAARSGAGRAFDAARDAASGAARSLRDATGDALEETRFRLDSLRDRIFGIPREPVRERRVPPSRPIAQPSIKLWGGSAKPSYAFVDGFWRTRRLPNTSQVVREYVRAHRRDLA